MSFINAKVSYTQSYTYGSDAKSPRTSIKQQRVAALEHKVNQHANQNREIHICTNIQAQMCV